MECDCCGTLLIYTCLLCVSEKEGEEEDESTAKLWRRGVIQRSRPLGNTGATYVGFSVAPPSPTISAPSVRLLQSIPASTAGETLSSSLLTVKNQVISGRLQPDVPEQRQRAKVVKS